MTFNLNTYQSARAKPLQARGKERVRVILASALRLFKERGIENVTTNDIASEAEVPIGSLYRYFPNKDAIVSALVELYAADLSKILQGIGEHPMLRYMSWSEVLLILVEACVNYARLNSQFALLYVVRANPQLNSRNQEVLGRYISTFHETLQKRCPLITKRDAVVYFQLLHSAVELGVRENGAEGVRQVPMHYHAAEIVATYLTKTCLPHDHS